MALIKETLDRISNYKSNLITTIKDRIDYLKINSQGSGEKFDQELNYLRSPQLLLFLQEIELCDTYIAYLTAWHLHYNGPSIPFDNSEVIRTVEEFIDNEINKQQIRERLRKSFNQ